ncbi:hypothetical protein [Vitiosangium sp. GDMCC 1.1324]|uniref:hypothetical protein n=1 Tax=Vitiosangium sp. (strain GDMCC 1.1324) TaxID=2138576 RepID=UPI000D3817FF|nr:hypothetical protein [Vitiosangium sp. GDMCC 1.1324]PTL81976.1 hypothetical protein DAT35_19360 [Vitiosangium sp. GDMCC 1.1324]
MSQEHDRNMAGQARAQHAEDQRRVRELEAKKEQIERGGHVKDSKQYMENERELEQARKDAQASKASADKLQKNYDDKYKR